MADEFVERELVFFPGIYSDRTAVWQRDKVVRVKGKVNAKDRAGNMSDEVKLLVDSVEEITAETIKDFKQSGKRAKLPKARAKVPTKTDAVQRLYVRIASSKDESTLLNIKQVLDAHPGDTEVVLVIGEADKQAVRLPQKIDNKSGFKALTTVIGKDNVKLH